MTPQPDKIINEKILDGITDNCQIIGHNWTYQYLNRAALVEARIPKEQMLNRKIGEVFPGFEQTRLYIILNQCMQNREPMQFEDEFTFPDGQKGWYEYSVEPVEQGLLILSRNITERKKIAIEVNESEERYRQLIESMPYTVFIQQNSKFVFINQAGLQLFGATSPNQIIGRDILDLIHPDYRNQVKKRIHASNEENRNLDLVEEKYLRLDGSTMDVEVVGAPIIYKNRPGAVVVVREITETIAARNLLKQKEEEVFRSNQLLNAFVQATPLGIAIIDESHKLSRWNKSAEMMFTCPSSEFILPDGRINMDLAPDVFKYLEDQLSVQELTMYETRMRRKDGTWFDASLSTNQLRNGLGEWTGAMAIFADISQRKISEYNLQNSESRYRRLVDSSPDAIIICTRGKITFANQAGISLLGAESASTLLNRDFSAYLTPGSIEKYTHMVETNIHEETLQTELELIPIHKKEIICDSSIIPLSSRENDSYQIIMRDVTEKKLEEQILNARLYLLEFANKHTMKELLTATLDQAEILTHSRVGFYHFVNEDTKEISLQTWSTNTMQEYCKVAGYDEHYPVDKAGVWAESVYTHKPVIHNDYASLSNRKGLPEGHAELNREMVVPVIRQDKVVALLGIGNKPEDYNDRDVKITSRLADLAWEIVALKRSNDELDLTKNRYHQLFQNMLEGYAYCQIVYDDNNTPVDFIYLDINEAFEKITGIHDVVGKRVTEIIPGISETNPELLNIYYELINNHQQNEYEVFLQQLNMWLDISVFNFENGYFVTVFDDITVRKTSELEIRKLLDESRRRLNLLEALHNIDLVINSNIHLKTILDEFLKQVMNILKVSAADILMVDQDKLMCQTIAYRGFSTSNFFANKEFSIDRYFSGKTLLDRTMTRLDDEDLKHSPNRFRSFLSNEGFIDGFSIPLISKGRVIGILEVFTKAKMAVDDEWIKFLETIAPQAAIAIENSKLFENLQKSNLSLTIAYDETIEGWSHALDLRDKETEGHTQRVTDITLALAEQMGLGEEDCKYIRWGALLHDIGKMGIPDSILLKPGPLTDDEWKIMRRHPRYAYDLLKPIIYLEKSVEIPLYHHEKWDGTGYPHGEKGKQIPLGARIFSVVDVWDALTSHRPYRPAWTQEQAREYILEQSGKHFDPEIVDVFMTFLVQNILP